MQLLAAPLSDEPEPGSDDDNDRNHQNDQQLAVIHTPSFACRQMRV